MSEFPGYWYWMELLAKIGTLASVSAVREELESPDVSDWADSLPAGVFRQPDSTVSNAVLEVSQWVKTQTRFTLTAKQAFLKGADRHLVAEAVAYGDTVVTYEISAPSSKRRVKIPDVCQAFGIECIFPQDMLSREDARFVLDDTVRTALETSRASPIRS